MTDRTASTYRVADVPALVVHPAPATANGRLALWMHYLGGSKDAMRPALQQLAGRGFTAVSFDAWQHGDRALESVPDLMARVFGHFRAAMWPILGHTVLDALAVIDHALDRFGLDTDVAAGGVSMGGDLAVALAGVDTRISRVAAMIATPDWTRPGMTLLDDPDTVIGQGEPTRLGQYLYDTLDPMTHLERYRRRPEITFDLGGDDRHIPRANAEAFRDALTRLEPQAAQRVQIRVHDGLDHLAAGRDLRPRLPPCTLWQRPSRRGPSRRRPEETSRRRPEERRPQPDDDAGRLVRRTFPGQLVSAADGEQ